MSEWNYDEAFSRNLGLISPQEQQVLKQSRVAICGMGGVGGVHAVTLARLGIGKFSLSDFDQFEMANFNRQYGAFFGTLGKSKVEVMIHYLKEINPQVDIRVFPEGLNEKNVDNFLEGCDFFIDGIDAFVIDLRALIFAKARERKIYSLSAGPFGFSTAWVVFAPDKMSFSQYVGFDRTADIEHKTISFLLAMAPQGWHVKYMDKSYFNFSKHRGPSVGLACQLASGVAAAEVIKVLLKRGKVYCAPYYQQFDPYLGKFKRGYLFWGGKNPLLRLKIRIAKWMLCKIQQ